MEDNTNTNIDVNTNPENNVDNTNTNDNGGVKLPTTPEELQAMLQAEADKRVSSAKKKFEADMVKKIEAEKAEAERLAKLTVEEKEKEILKKQLEDFQNKEKELARKELELKTFSFLTEKQLPVEFKDFVLGNDEEETKGRIDTLSKVFNKSLEAMVNERLKGKTLNNGTSSTGEMTKEAFLKLSYKDRVQLFNTNPELYTKLSK